MYVVWFTVLICAHLCQGLNVLVWSTTIGHSHVKFMGAIADLLHGDKHNVTLVLLENDPDVVTVGTKHVKNIIKFRSPLVGLDEWSHFNFKQGDVFKTQTIAMGDFFRMQSINNRLCQSLLEDESLLGSLKNSNFDLAVVEFFNFCPAGLLDIIGVKKVMLATALGMTHAHYELFNFNMPLSHVPVQMTHLGSKMTFFGRIYNVVFYYVSKFCYNYILFQDQLLFNKKFGTFPALDDLYREKIDYVLTNTNELTESTRPTLPNVHFVGGSTVPNPVPINKEFNQILSTRKSTILFSLGSVVRPEMMPEFIKNAFLEAFLEFPEYTFIWKTAAETNFTYPNIYYKDWVPQVDLLADGRVKAFITHAGMNSVQEALLFGVPLIAMPIFADQDSNAVVASERGYCHILDKFSVDKQQVVEAIKKVLGTEGSESSYTQAARHAAKILKGSRRAMRQNILRLTQLSGTVPTQRHLRLNSDHLNYFQYYNIDVYVFLTISVVLSVLLLRFSYEKLSRFEMKVKFE